MKFNLFFVFILFSNSLFSQKNDTLKQKNNFAEFGFMTSILPRIIGIDDGYTISKVPDNKIHIGYGFKIGGNWRLTKNLSINSSFSLLVGKSSYNTYRSVVRNVGLSYYTNKQSTNTKLSYILNSILLDFSYNFINCNNDKNLFIEFGCSLNQKEVYKNDNPLYPYKVTFVNYFNDFLKGSEINISPIFSLKYEKRIANKWFFIENELILLIPESSTEVDYLRTKTKNYCNRIILGMKI